MEAVDHFGVMLSLNVGVRCVLCDLGENARCDAARYADQVATILSLKLTMAIHRWNQGLNSVVFAERDGHMRKCLVMYGRKRYLVPSGIM